MAGAASARRHFMCAGDLVSGDEWGAGLWGVLMVVGMGVVVLSLAVSMRGIHRLHSHCSNKFQSGHRGIE